MYRANYYVKTFFLMLCLKSASLFDGDQLHLILWSFKSIDANVFFSAGRRKVHFKFSDGREMVEEYSLDTNVTLRRAWKVTKKFGAQPKWETEIGDPDPTFAEQMENTGIVECSTAVNNLIKLYLSHVIFK